MYYFNKHYVLCNCQVHKLLFSVHTLHTVQWDAPLWSLLELVLIVPNMRHVWPEPITISNLHGKYLVNADLNSLL